MAFVTSGYWLRVTSSAPAWLAEDNLRFLLGKCQTWAVVGLSGDPTRTAYRVAGFLQDRGKRIVPVHPDAPVVLGEQGYPTLADVPFDIDCVDVFRRSAAAGQFADEALRTQMQEFQGKLAEAARAKGATVRGEQRRTVGFG